MTDILDTSGLSFSDDIINAGDSQIDLVKFMVYGPSGAGKTQLLSTMPDPLLYLLTEKQGAMTVKRVNPHAQIVFIEDIFRCLCHRKHVDKCPNGAKAKVEKIKAKDLLYQVLDDLATKDHPFVSVALDSLTDMQQILLSDMKGGVPGAEVSLKDWGKLIDRTKDLIIRLRNLNMHVGTICLSDETLDNRQRLIRRPALAGKKLPGNVIQYFNICAYQQKTMEDGARGGAVYSSLMDAGDEYYTKTHPALDHVEIPSVRLWVDKIREYALVHNEGQMPTRSSPVANPVKRTSDDEAFELLKKRIEQPKIKERFDQLEAPEAKRLAAAQKYKADDKLLEILDKRLVEQAQMKKDEEERKAKELRDKEQRPSALPSLPAAPNQAAPAEGTAA